MGIGILAYNEEENIPTTLHSLFNQSLFSDRHIDDNIEISCIAISIVPNGCQDKTAQVSSTTLEELIQEKLHESALCPDLTGSVTALEKPGKSNALNVYIHELVDSNTDLILMIDADIVFDEVDTIKNSIKTLLDNKEADVVVDTPLKSFHKKSAPNFLEKISLRVSKEYLDSSMGIAGSFYCSYAAILRQIWMPVGLPGEDGFLKAMIITDMFRSKPDEKKIVRAENASHFYVPETSIKGILKHELRAIIGTSINCYLTWDFLLFATDPKGPGAGLVLKNLIEKEPDWLQAFISNTVKNKGFWVLPRGTLSKGIRSLRGKSLLRHYKSYISVCFRLAVNFPLFLIANHKIKSGKAIGFW